MKPIPIVFLFFLLLHCYGCLYTNIKIPLDDDVNDTVLGTKVGMASSYSVAWLFAWGDCGTRAAAQNGGIHTIKHLDQHIISVLFGLYAERETVAYGD